MYVCVCCTCTEVNVVTLVTKNPSGLFTVESELQYKVAKEDSESVFSCEVSYYVPGAVRTVESRAVNVTVHCKLTYIFFIYINVYT